MKFLKFTDQDQICQIGEPPKPVLLHDYKSLKTDTLLNDGIVNAYLEYLVKHELDPVKKEDVFVWPTTFWQKYNEQNMESKKSKHLGVSRWTKHVNIF